MLSRAVSFPRGGKALFSAAMVVLETERLRLRWMTLEDAPLLLELMNDPAFILYVADRGLRTVEDAERYLTEKVLPSFDQNGFGMNVVELKTSAMAVGTCGLVKREHMEHVDIGYAFRRDFWGQGFAYEAAAALFQYGQEVLGLPKIVAITAPGNERSIKLLEKLGLRFDRMIATPGVEGESKLFV